MVTKLVKINGSYAVTPVSLLYSDGELALGLSRHGMEVAQRSACIMRIVREFAFGQLKVAYTLMFT